MIKVGHAGIANSSLLRGNAPASSGSAKTSFWLRRTVKAAYPPKTMRSRSRTSWKIRSTLVNDSQSATDNEFAHELSGGVKSSPPTTNVLTTKEVGYQPTPH